MKALVVEDDPDIATQLKQSLSQHGYAVDVSHSGNEGWFLGGTETYDVILLDLGLPEKDGISILTSWRQSGNSVPVLILTARDSWREKVTGLRAGADDYLAKPFEMEEMLARIEVLIRRSSGHASSIIRCGELELDPASQRITDGGKLLSFSALEYRLVAYMILNQGKVVSKTQLNEHLYEQGFDRDSNVIEVLVNRCRKKLRGDRIQTLRGQGYIIHTVSI